MPTHWTVMVYLAGDNNLDAYGSADLVEMKAIGSTREVTVVAQFDRMGDGITRRFYLAPNRTLDADIVDELQETNTGDPLALLEFIRWALREYPSERTALILWNHGAGWKDDDIYAIDHDLGVPAPGSPRSVVRRASQSRISRSLFSTSIEIALQYPAASRAILFDDTSKDFLDNQELKRCLDALLIDRRGKKLDLIGFDACLMTMVEVAYQVQHACHYMVGSQEVEPGDGWPYQRLLAALVREPTQSAEQLGQSIVDAYTNHYLESPPSIAVTQSALSLDHLPPLVEAVDHLSYSLVDRLTDGRFYGRTLMPVLRDVQKFRDHQYVDLGHFCNLLTMHTSDTTLREQARVVAEHLEPSVSSVVAAVGNVGEAVASAHGLSIYVPFMGPISPAYSTLEFAQQCRWSSFIHAFSEG